MMRGIYTCYCVHKMINDARSVHFQLKRAYRMMVVSAQYRTPLSFTEETFKAAANSLKRIEKCMTKMNEVISSGHEVTFEESNGYRFIIFVDSDIICAINEVPKTYYWCTFCLLIFYSISMQVRCRKIGANCKNWL